MILLNEATTEQIIEELHNRSEYLALLISKPSNEQEFYTSWKGNFVQKMGMAHLLKTEIESKDFYEHFNFFDDQENEEDEDF